MDEKIIYLLEQINEKLESIDNTLKAFDKKQFSTHSSKYKTKEKSKNKEIKKNEQNNKDDILKNWESKMPYDEVLKKMHTYKKLKE